jgi:hypothetical protein
MIGLSIRIGKQVFAVTPASVLYGVAWGGSLAALYIIWPILGIRYESLEQYYIELGKITRIWGYIFGAAFLLTLFWLTTRTLLVAKVKSSYIRLSRIERILSLLFLFNIMWAILGILLGNPLSYIAGDTLKGMIFPALYWIVKKSVSQMSDVISLTKIILLGETILLLVLVPTGHIPFSQGGRTFLSTVYFTLLFEERDLSKRIMYVCLLLFGVYTILTTAAVRGIMLIFGAVIALNYFLRLRTMSTTVLLSGFVLPAVLLWGTNELLDLNLDRYADWATRRFSGSISRERKFFGLDESLAQRVGETIDVGRTFGQHSPIFLLTGFGNGAMLTNSLITPAELATYKTNKKHPIYVTVVALMFRNGLIGLALYGAFVLYLVRIAARFRKNRLTLASTNNRESVYLKVLLFYQIAVFAAGFVSYVHMGNVIVAFTLPLLESLRRNMEVTLATATHS